MNSDTATGADRHLLLGMLALHNGFLDASTLAEAIRAQQEEPRESLAELLLRQGVISPEERAVLEELVESHLGRHQNDPEASLAALDLNEVETCLLEGVLPEPTSTQPTPPEPGTTQRATSRVERPQAEPTAPASEKIERYRPLRPLARGGLGEVKVALDRELNREVALKEIRTHYAHDESSRRRFVLEAEVTGRLEHPGIVPVYGFGVYADGRPFYAMRLIRGESLREAITRFHRDDAAPARDPSRRHLELRRLLTRFVSVCNAIQYAHSRGVLHRDIKPDNIMLGAYGETLVVDWGLAKVTSREDEAFAAETSTGLPGSGSGSEGALRPTSMEGPETVEGRAIGTPDYMSPEQALGWHDMLSPASDVYSLGATLYVLITGKRPFPGGDVEQVLQDVRHGRFAPPREVNGRVDEALEAICLKAMASPVDERYASAEELANDIEAYLADEPVAAWREPFKVRASRWMRRRMPLVAASAAAAAVMLVSLVVGLVLLGVHNEQLAQERDAKEKNYQLARQAVDDYLTQVAEDPRLRAEGLEPLRRELLETASEYYEEFTRRRGDDPELLTEQARAYSRLGTITAEIDSGGAALEDYDASLKIYRRLWTETNSAGLLVEMAWVQNDRGILLNDLGRWNDAEAAYRAALAFLSRPEVTADSATTERLAASAHNNLGNLYLQLGKLAAAEREFGKARTIRQQQLAAYEGGRGTAEELMLRRVLAATLQNQGNLFGQTGRSAEAETAYGQAIELLTGAARRERPYETLELAQAHGNLAMVLAGVGRYDEADRHYEQAISTLTPLAERHPDVVAFGTRLANLENGQAALFRETGLPEQAVEAYRAALVRYEAAAEVTPDDPELASALAGTQKDLGLLLFQTGDAQAAGELLGSASEAFARLASEHANVPEYRARLASCQSVRAEIALGQGDDKAAADLFAQAEAEFRMLVTAAAEGAAPDYESSLAAALLNQAQLGVALGDYESADQQVQEGRQVLESLVTRFPEKLDYQDRLASALVLHSSLLAEQGQAGLARDVAREAVAMRQQLAERETPPAAAVSTWAAALNNLGDVEATFAAREAAVEAYEQALALLRPLLAEQGASPEDAHALAATLNNLAIVERQRGRLEEADAAYAEALEVREMLVGMNSESAAYERELAALRLNLANLKNELQEWEAAVELYTAGVAALAAVGDASPRGRLLLRNAHMGWATALEGLGRIEEALPHWDLAVDFATGDAQVVLRLERGECRARAGLHAQAAEDAAEVASAVAGYGPMTYRCAVVFALAARAVQDDAALPSRERLELQEQYATRGVGLLNQAAGSGYFLDPESRTLLTEDEQLAALRGRSDFGQLLEMLGLQ